MNELNITKILKNIETRKNTTKKGLKEVYEIIKVIETFKLENQRIEKTFAQVFNLKLSYNNPKTAKRGLFYFNINNDLGLHVKTSNERVKFFEFDYLDYINFKQFNLAVIELFDFLENLEPLEINLPELVKTVKV